MPSPTATTSPPGHQRFATDRSPTSTSGGTAKIATVDTKRPLGDRRVLSVMLPAARQRCKVAALPSPSLRSVPRRRPSGAGPAMTPDLSADHPSPLERHTRRARPYPRAARRHRRAGTLELPAHRHRRHLRAGHPRHRRLAARRVSLRRPTTATRTRRRLRDRRDRLRRPPHPSRTDPRRGRDRGRLR